MKIKQCNLTPPLKRVGHCWQFLQYYGLSKYNNPNKPAIFFGLYDGVVDIRKIKDHRSLAVVVWIGCDCFKKAHLRITKKLPHVRHIAISSFIERDLSKAGISYKFLPLRGCPIDDMKPAPLGDEIYTYIPSPEKRKNYKRYGGHIIDKLRSKCNYKINIINSPHQYNRKALKKIYKRCFCGLRLTDHDGLSNTVIDLGLMGRKCFTNDSRLPHSIKWSSDDIGDILQNIEIQAQKIGEVDYEIASAVKNYVNVGRKWLRTDYWG